MLRLIDTTLHLFLRRRSPGARGRLAYRMLVNLASLEQNSRR